MTKPTEKQEALTSASPDADLVERLLIEAYERGWREGCETLIEDYPDAMIAVPHKDAMGEGCSTFMGEIYSRIFKDLSFFT